MSDLNERIAAAGPLGVVNVTKEEMQHLSRLGPSEYDNLIENAMATFPRARSRLAEAEREEAKITSDGGSTSYYQLPEGAKELNDLIEHKGMGFALANIFKACYRMGEKDGADILYDLNKIVYFAKERLIPFVEKNGRLP